MKWVLMASAPDLESIKSSITRFYCGEEKDLGNYEDEAHKRTTFDLFHKGTTEKINGARVAYKRGRYRFEVAS